MRQYRENGQSRQPQMGGELPTSTQDPTLTLARQYIRYLQAAYENDRDRQRLEPTTIQGLLRDIKVKAAEHTHAVQSLKLAHVAAFITLPTVYAPGVILHLAEKRRDENYFAYINAVDQSNRLRQEAALLDPNQRGIMTIVIPEDKHSRRGEINEVSYRAARKMRVRAGVLLKHVVSGALQRGQSNLFVNEIQGKGTVISGEVGLGDFRITRLGEGQTEEDRWLNARRSYTSAVIHDPEHDGIAVPIIQVQIGNMPFDVPLEWVTVQSPSEAIVTVRESFSKKERKLLPPPPSKRLLK